MHQYAQLHGGAATWSKSIFNGYTLLWPLRLTQYRLFNQGVGRPSMISERNIQAPLPPIVPNIEYGLWEDTEMAPQKVSLISYCTSTFRYTCEMLRMTAGPLDEM